MKTAYRYVDRGARYVSAALAALSGVLIVVIMLLIGADVVGRLVGAPLRGVVAVASSGVVALAFLAMPYTLRRRAHVRSTLLRSRLGPGGRRAVDVVAYGLAAAVFIVIAVSSWGRMVNAWAIGEYSGEGTLRVPAGPTRTALVVASAVMALEALLALARSAFPSTEPADG